MDIKSIIELFKTTSIEYILWSTVAIFIIWLFKESRNQYLAVTRMNHERIANALETYAGIYSVLVEDTVKDDIYYEKVSKKLSLGYSYYTKTLLNKVIDWQREKNDVVLNNIIELLVKEIKYLKSLQHDDISAGSPGDFFIDSIYYFFRKSNINSFITPAFYTFIFLVLILLLGLFGFVINEADIKSEILYCFNIFAFFFIFVTSTTTIDLILSKKLRFDIKKWCLFIAYLIITISLLFIGPWYRSIVNVVVIFGYIYIFGKYFKKE